MSILWDCVCLVCSLCLFLKVFKPSRRLWVCSDGSRSLLEEHLLQGVEAPSTLVVGMEGFWGFILTAFVALPIAYVLPGEEGNGLHEDFIDSLILW